MSERDIVERLGATCGPGGLDGMRRDAATEITTLRAQISTLQASLAAAEGERDRYRAALTKIAAFGDAGGNLGLERRGSYASFDEPASVEIARAALSPPPAGQGSGT